MRRSSIWPENHSDQTALPPMWRGPEPLTSPPVTGLLETWAPFTYSRSVEPS